MVPNRRLEEDTTMAHPDRRDEAPRELASRDPIGFEDKWLRATEDETGQDTLEGAIDVATGADPRGVDDPVVNGYRGVNRSLTEPPGPEHVPDAKAHPH